MADGVAHRRGPHQLPPGRHGLPRAFVISNQRERILDGVMAAVSRTGYAELRVEDVIRHAGVSRRTFYDHFANKEEAFLAAYDLVVDQLHAAVFGALATGASWAAGVRRGLAAFLNLLAAEPVLAHVCVVDVMGAGPRARDRRTAALQRFAHMLQPPAEDGARAEVPSLTAETVVGGLYEVVYARLVDGQFAELPSLLPPLLYSVLLPFAGPEVAGAEYRRALGTAASRRAAEAAGAA